MTPQEQQALKAAEARRQADFREFEITNRLLARGKDGSIKSAAPADARARDGYYAELEKNIHQYGELHKLKVQQADADFKKTGMRILDKQWQDKQSRLVAQRDFEMATRWLNRNPLGNESHPEVKEARAKQHSAQLAVAHLDDELKGGYAKTAQERAERYQKEIDRHEMEKRDEQIKHEEEKHNQQLKQDSDSKAAQRSRFDEIAAKAAADGLREHEEEMRRAKKKPELEEGISRDSKRPMRQEVRDQVRNQEAKAPVPKEITGYTHKIERDHVVYARASEPNTPAFREFSHRIAVSKHDLDVHRQALTLASERFEKGFKIRGDEDFKRAAATEAFEMGLREKIKNPELQSLFKELEAKKLEAKERELKESNSADVKADDKDREQDESAGTPEQKLANEPGKEPVKETREPEVTKEPEKALAPDETQVPQEVKVPQESQVPIKTQEAQESPEPEAVQEAQETEVPVETPVPEEAQEPQETREPEETQVPEEVQESEKANGPDETPEPVETQVPQESQVPEESPEPVETQEPVEAPEPEETQATQTAQPAEAAEAADPWDSYADTMESANTVYQDASPIQNQDLDNGQDR